jgi:V8-like Glu-specific endopeptidase
MIHLFLMLSVSIVANAHNKIVYGVDNRKDLYEVEPRLQEVAQSTAAMVNNSKLGMNYIVSSSNYLASTLGQREMLCSDQRFKEQPVLAYCSGFLIAPDVLVTAGHCMDSENSCSGYSWVFGFNLASSVQVYPRVTNDNIYKCKEVIKTRLDSLTDQDYAIIKLDRPVTGNRKPLKLATRRAEVGDEILMIGHPSGLPTKIADGAQVLGQQTASFRTNLDAFHVNSGSAVFDSQSLEVIGILVRGRSDYRTREMSSCEEVNVMAMSDGGESVSHISQVKNALSSVGISLR